MNHKERDFQYALPKFLDVEFVPILPPKETGAPLLTLSQSKLEQLAEYQKHPIKSPLSLNTNQLVNTTAGIIFHSIAQVTSTWRAIIPASPYNQRQNYQHNLDSRLSTINPSSKSKEIREIHALLNNDARLVFPYTPVNQHHEAKKQIYQIIAEKVIQLQKTKPPFSDTLALDPYQFNPDNLPYPQPKQFCQIWSQSNIESDILQRTENLLNYHDSLTIIPSLISHHDPGHFGQELRTNMLIPRSGVIWTTRFDEISITQDALTNRRQIHIIDYKLHSAKFMPENTFSREMQRLSIFLAAMTASALPDRLPINGKSIQIPYQGINPDLDIHFHHLGFKTSPPSQIQFERYWGNDWTYTGLAKIQLNLLDQTLTYIQDNRDSLSHLFPQLKKRF